MSMGTSTSIERANRALQAGQRARIVQHASLRPAHEDDAAQMRFAVEDALNTADFADCGRLIVVRQLRLANVPPRASSAWMARPMESAWRSLAMQAVPAAHASAASAQAVYFASRVEARLAWLERVACGQKVGAWFWAAAMPELKVVGAQSMPALDAVIEVLLREAAPAVLAELNAWPDAAVVSLVRAMSPASHRTMVLALTRSTPLVGGPTHSAARVGAAKGLPDVLLTVAGRLSGAAPMAQEAASSLAALWMTPALARAPSLDEVQAVVTRAVWMAAGSAPAARAEEDPARAAVPSPADRGNELPGDAERLESAAPPQQATMSRGASDSGRHAMAPAPPPPAWRVESGLKVTPRRSGRAVDAHPNAPRGLPWLADAAFTAQGGLMLLLNVLRAMRFDSPSASFVDALMVHMLDAVGAPEDEPQRAWFEAKPVPSHMRDGDFDRLSPNGDGLAHRGASIPQPERILQSVFGRSNPFGLRYRNPGGAHQVPFGLSLSKAPTDSLRGFREEPSERRRFDPQLRVWRLRIRRTLRRHVGLDLPGLIRRPAWVSATATHIDVVYPMSDIDLRLRRRGLDADPGWVPWFGRIVTFHFIDDDLLPSQEAEHG